MIATPVPPRDKVIRGFSRLSRFGSDVTLDLPASSSYRFFPLPVRYRLPVGVTGLFAEG
jgi:hypothetical protein